MDLVSSLRKEGSSRGGVNFSWSDVQSSVHRENYLGHSLMAPVGRWQMNKDLNWYAKGDDKKNADGETVEEQRARERKEEIRKVKEAEEDALARALGLPVKERNLTDANTIPIKGEELRKVIKDTENETSEPAQGDSRKAFAESFIGSRRGIDRDTEATIVGDENSSVGGLIGRGGEKRRDRSADRSKRHSRHHRRQNSPDDEGHRERRRRRSRSPDRKDRRHRSRSPDRRERRARSRSPDDRRQRRDDRKDHKHRPRHDRSPDRLRRRDRDDASRR